MLQQVRRKTEQTAAEEGGSFFQNFRVIPTLISGLVAGGAAIFGVDYLSRRTYDQLYEAVHKDFQWDPSWYAVEPEMRLVGGPEDGWCVDRRQDQERTEIGLRTVYFVRHAQYVKADGKLTLTELGKQQAEATGKRLRELIPKECLVRSIYHSQTGPAGETAILMSKSFTRVPVRESPALREGIPVMPDPPHPNLQLSEEEMAADREMLDKAFHRFMDPPQGSDIRNIDADIIVAHGNMLRYFICKVAQLDPAAWLRFRLLHASVTVVQIDARGGVLVKQMGDVGHLPAAALTN